MENRSLVVQGDVAQWLSVRFACERSGVRLPASPPSFFTHLQIGNLTYHLGSVAEWSKALVLGTSLCGGVGSNPTTAIFADSKGFPLLCTQIKNGDAGVRTPDLLHAKQALYH